MMDNFNNDIWDEYQWEEHINRMEKKSEELRKFIEDGRRADQPRWASLLSENSDKFDAVKAFIEEELSSDEFLFDDSDDEWPEDEDDSLSDLLEGDDEWWDDEDVTSFDEEDEGEKWKEFSGEFTFSEQGNLKDFEIYNRGYELSVQTLKWADDMPSKWVDETFSDFVGSTLTISAKLAGGYSFGFETEFIGGNIACTKKALNAANKALSILENDLKERPFMEPPYYNYFHRTIFELRNDIGIYVQDLRDRFNLGID